MSWVVVLGGRELFGEAADELASTRLVVLVESGAYGMVTRIKTEVVLGIVTRISNAPPKSNLSEV